MGDQPLSMRWPREFVERVDAARGDVPRSVWLRRVVERALDGASGDPAVGAHVEVHRDFARAAKTYRAPDPVPPAVELGRRGKRAGGFVPRPKKGGA